MSVGLLQRIGVPWREYDDDPRMTRIFPAGHCGAFTALTDDIAEQHGLDLARPAITA